VLGLAPAYSAVGALAFAALALAVCPGMSFAETDGHDGSSRDDATVGTDAHVDPTRRNRSSADAFVGPDARREGGGGIPTHFVGFSVEWSLVERYMGQGARPAFANLLRNLRTGVLRIGGITQDVMRFDAAGANSIEAITPEDLAFIRTTLDATNADDGGDRAPSWGVILGTGMTPPSKARPWLDVNHARAFITEGVEPAFSSGGGRYVAGIELGNEPDITYDADVVRYLTDFASFSEALAGHAFGLVGPNTSAPIAPWAELEARTVPTRFFWEWPAILEEIAPELAANAGAFGAFATDHFYPMSRSCASDAYRCATISRLLSEERMSNFEYQVHAHAREAARHGLRYRLEEMNSAASRGVEGVSDVAASAVWALDAMFRAACPRPPGSPPTNGDCTTGAIGVNFHNAEVREFFQPQEGNAFYNAIRYDPGSAMGAPTAAPVYYALLLFSRLAQDTNDLRAVAVTLGNEGDQVKGWAVTADDSERRLFLINKGLGGPVTVTVAAPDSPYEVVRMSPHDPSGAGQTLTAPEVRIDGRAVAPDGTWPGFASTAGEAAGGRLQIELGPAEAAVVIFR
jgi:hypothetical protein